MHLTYVIVISVIAVLCCPADCLAQFSKIEKQRYSLDLDKEKMSKVPAQKTSVFEKEGLFIEKEPLKGESAKIDETTSIWQKAKPPKTQDKPWQRVEPVKESTIPKIGQERKQNLELQKKQIEPIEPKQIISPATTIEEKLELEKKQTIEVPKKLSDREIADLKELFSTLPPEERPVLPAENNFQFGPAKSMGITPAILKNRITKEHLPEAFKQTGGTKEEDIFLRNLGTAKMLTLVNKKLSDKQDMTEKQMEDYAVKRIGQYLAKKGKIRIGPYLVKKGKIGNPEIFSDNLQKYQKGEITDQNKVISEDDLIDFMLQEKKSILKLQKQTTSEAKKKPQIIVEEKGGPTPGQTAIVIGAAGAAATAGIIAGAIAASDDDSEEDEEKGASDAAPEPSGVGGLY